MPDFDLNIINSVIDSLPISKSPDLQGHVSDLQQVFSCIDNTTLSGTDSSESVSQFCTNTRYLSLPNGQQVAAVCVYPVFVFQARKALQGSSIRVASVAGAFPHGQSPISIKVAEVQYAVDQGADEIDMVISRGAFLQGNFAQVASEISAIRKAAANVTLKVILETAELESPSNIYQASLLALESGADFIKTSTGKISVGATPKAAYAMLSAIRDFSKNSSSLPGFKAAGGISNPSDALIYFQLAKSMLGTQYSSNHYFRIGASRLTNRLLDFLTLQ